MSVERWDRNALACGYVAIGVEEPLHVRRNVQRSAKSGPVNPGAAEPGTLKIRLPEIRAFQVGPLEHGVPGLGGVKDGVPRNPAA